MGRDEEGWEASEWGRKEGGGVGGGGGEEGGRA